MLNSLKKLRSMKEGKFSAEGVVSEESRKGMDIFVPNLLERGTDIRWIQNLSAHADIKTTDTYLSTKNLGNIQ